jgi:hypothetical protein
VIVTLLYICASNTNKYKLLSEHILHSCRVEGDFWIHDWRVDGGRFIVGELRGDS